MLSASWEGRGDEILKAKKTKQKKPQENTRNSHHE